MHVPLPERRARITATLDARRTPRAARPAAGLGDRQALAIAKTPTDGGVACLTLAMALAARERVLVTLVGAATVS
ncbi:hypothetical protein ABT187_28515 [Streptomyces sp. NPDC001817]|uniref:hypothetical protein n=1 Tax=Streptomyces sp. NPDC001817 TaxID=3154398 RepID=UPI0033305359